MATIYCKKEECKFCSLDICIKTIVRIDETGCASYDPKNTERGAEQDD